MSEPDIQKYCDLMEEIKRRIDVVDFFLYRGGHTLYLPTTVESACLQIRKVLELVAFGSLVANKDIYSRLRSRFAKHWHAGDMLQALERVNHDFYPKPVVEVQTENPAVVHGLRDRGPDYLSRREFEEVYGRCGEIMHARNPYRSDVKYEEYLQMLQQWRQKIANLLNNHQVRLVNDPGFYLIHMKEDRDNKVHFYRFQPRPTKLSSAG